jgi:hypothetical protein
MKPAFSLVKPVQECPDQIGGMQQLEAWPKIQLVVRKNIQEYGVSINDGKLVSCIVTYQFNDVGEQASVPVLLLDLGNDEANHSRTNYLDVKP